MLKAELTSPVPALLPVSFTAVSGAAIRLV